MRGPARLTQAAHVEPGFFGPFKLPDVCRTAFWLPTRKRRAYPKFSCNASGAWRSHGVGALRWAQLLLSPFFVLPRYGVIV